MTCIRPRGVFGREVSIEHSRAASIGTRECSDVTYLQNIGMRFVRVRTFEFATDDSAWREDMPSYKSHSAVAPSGSTAKMWRSVATFANACDGVG